MLLFIFNSSAIFACQSFDITVTRLSVLDLPEFCRYEKKADTHLI